MQLSRLGLLALGALTAVDAFRDTSPFFFFSTHEYETTSQQIQSATSVLDDVTNKLLSCSSDIYILVSQPGVHAMDYSTKRSAPRLREQILKKDEAVKSSFTVSEVVGEIDTPYLQSMLESKCGAGTMQVDTQSESLPSPSSYESWPQVIQVDFPTLVVGSNREEQLASNDAYLASLVDLLPTPNYTVLYASTPRGDDASTPAAEQPSPGANPNSHHGALHIQQRRNTHPRSHVIRDDDGDSDSSNLSLFEKYQFLSPGIFMGLIAAIPLILILYFGLSALASLQVSYASFTKESGPTSGKKQQ